jgi:hypothetical protein
MYNTSATVSLSNGAGAQQLNGVELFIHVN